MKQRAWGVIAALALAMCVQPAQAQGTPGALVVIGGGSVPREARVRALELSRAKQPIVAVLPQASGLPDRGKRSGAPWLEAGAAEVLLLDPLNAGARAALERAHVIWIPGGSQSRLMNALREAKLVEVIRARHAAGAVIAGTSAGAAVMSTRMLTGDADLKSVEPGKTRLAEGLGLWPGVIVDQHFVRRQRNNRLLAAVLDHPQERGVGIDEGTAVIVTRAGIEVVGIGTVLVYDARKAKLDPNSTKHGATDVRLHVLRAGMRLPSR